MQNNQSKNTYLNGYPNADVSLYQHRYEDHHQNQGGQHGYYQGNYQHQGFNQNQQIGQNYCGSSEGAYQNFSV